MNEAREEREDLSLSDAAEYLLEECRMVLPGIQALFGFQLIAVFSPGFSEKLTASEQQLHAIAILLVAFAVATIMTPAAYHRQTNPRQITASFLKLSTTLLLASMPPLAIGICLDFYLVARVILGGVTSAALAAALALVFLVLWFLLPRMQGILRIMGRKR